MLEELCERYGVCSTADVRKRRRGDARDRPLPPLLARVGGNIEVSIRLAGRVGPDRTGLRSD